MKKNKTLFACLIFIGINQCIMAQNSNSEYKIANKIHLTGDGGWDYLSVDETGNRLFVSHGTIVQVVDLNTQTLIGTIPDTKGVHGITLAYDLNKGFISNGKDTSVTVFDLKTLQAITKVKITGLNPDAILYDEFSHMVFVYNGKSANATVIDAKTNEVKTTMPLDGKPEFSVTDGKGKVFVNIEDKSEISMINSATLKVEQTWSIAPGQEPSGLALDNENHRLFSVCDNKLMVVVDAENGKVITQLPIGERVDGAAFDPDKKRVYSSNGDGTLTVVQEESKDAFKVIENVETQKGARTIAVDKKTHHIYLPTAEYGDTPESTKENPHPRPVVKPDTFVVLDIQCLK